MRVLCIFIFWFLIFEASAQEDTWKKEFQEFQADNQKEFDDFRNQINTEFANKLQSNWEEFNVSQPVLKPTIPKPDNPPIPDTSNNKEYIKKPVLVDVPNVTPSEIPKKVISPDDVLPDIPENIQISPEINKLTLKFYGLSLDFSMEPSLKVKCLKSSEKEVSNYWKSISEANYVVILAFIEKYSEQYHFNDWTLYLLVKRLSENVHSEWNSQIAFQFFFLNQLGYDTKLASIGQELYLMINFANTIYNSSFITLNNKQYYFMSEIGSKSIHTMSLDFSSSARPIDLGQKMIPDLGGNTQSRTLYLRDQKRQLRLIYSSPVIEYFNEFPSSDFSICFNASMDQSASKSILQELGPLLTPLSEPEAVQMLLSFVHHSFDYQTDDQQFGREKYFFPEEILAYPFSDCEDRSVFFSYLVRSLLGLEVVGLQYPGHIATAVKFNVPITGDAVRVDGNVYIICDPTYIGSTIGEAMPQFRYTSPEAIRIERN